MVPYVGRKAVTGRYARRRSFEYVICSEIEVNEIEVNKIQREPFGGHRILDDDGLD